MRKVFHYGLPIQDYLQAVVMVSLRLQSRKSRIALLFPHLPINASLTVVASYARRATVVPMVQPPCSKRIPLGSQKRATSVQHTVSSGVEWSKYTDNSAGRKVKVIS